MTEHHQANHWGRKKYHLKIRLTNVIIVICNCTSHGPMIKVIEDFETDIAAIQEHHILLSSIPNFTTKINKLGLNLFNIHRHNCRKNIFWNCMAMETTFRYCDNSRQYRSSQNLWNHCSNNCFWTYWSLLYLWSCCWNCSWEICSLWSSFHPHQHTWTCHKLWTLMLPITIDWHVDIMESISFQRRTVTFWLLHAAKNSFWHKVCSYKAITALFLQ